MTAITVQAQTSAWTEASFHFTRDNAVPEDMTGATGVSFPGSMPLSSLAIVIPGFTFRYGLRSFQSFYISPYGFIKLGSTVVSKDPESDSSVIVPLYNGTEWGASYKLVGVSPERKMVVQFSGVMQPSGEPTFFQVWLYEKSGAIQFVYPHLRGFYGYGASWSYKIFCATDILNQRTVASVKINGNNAAPSVSYSTTPASFDSIYTNTRFTFQPDTVKPAAPASLSFSNVTATSLDINVKESAHNETLLAIERLDATKGYLPEKLFYPIVSGEANSYIYKQMLLQPFSDYTYRVYLSNGFVNSDTINGTIRTLMPQLNGVIRIPGDYPSVTSLLREAVSKQFGPDVIIELQKNYAENAETFPIMFGPNLQNRFIKSIVIRPAAGATITWGDSSSPRRAMFYVDSVRHVFIDGRPGGTGDSRNFTIYQRNPTAAIIQYTNAADSGGVRYCNLIKKGSEYTSSSIVVVPSNIDFNVDKRDVNAFSITNNFISADSGTVEYLINVKPSDTAQARDFVIDNNQFSRFATSAIQFENGGENLRISGNSFFQPERFHPLVFLPYLSASCVTLINVGKVKIDSNFFGGGSPIWGKGKFAMDNATTNFSFIYYQNHSSIKEAIISNNKFGNIESNNWNKGPTMIYTSGGRVVITKNQLGTADSANSITSSSYFYGISAWLGTEIISGNFFSGFQGGYHSDETANHSYFVSTAVADSLLLINNDIGGSNSIEANSSSGFIHGIYLSPDCRSVILKKNVIRGISSRKSSVIAISGANGLAGVPLDEYLIDSNSIHHIQAASYVWGIDLHLNSTKTNVISNNEMYALKTTGIVNGNYGPTGTLVGIKYSIYNNSVAPDKYEGEVRISGNKIHSFEAQRILSNSIFSFMAISAASPISKIYNNEIRFGINTRGKYIDTLTTLSGISIYPLDYQSFLSDKHYIEHNTIYFGGKGPVESAISCLYDYNYVSDKNKVTVTNNILDIERTPREGTKLKREAFINISSISAQSAKNLWYSARNPNVPDLLAGYKEFCKCDASSFVDNPVLVNPEGDSIRYDLHLGISSKADGTGDPAVVNIVYDLDGKSRKSYSPVDIGCYASGPCGDGNLPVITIVNPSVDTIFLCGQEKFTIKSHFSSDSVTSVRWQRNLVDVPGANNDSLEVDSAGEYRLVGISKCGMVGSRLIYVLRNPLSPKVYISNSHSTICSDQQAAFTAIVENEGNALSFQWQVNGINTGTDTSVFVTSTLKDQDEIKVILTSNACGFLSTAESEPLKINVVPSPKAFAGIDTTICSGNSVPLGDSEQVQGVSYEWSPTQGLSNPFIRNPIASPQSTVSYALMVRNLNNCISKDTVVVTVLPYAASPTIEISTKDTVICEGTAAAFTAAMFNEGSDPMVQWQVNGIDAGVNSKTFIADHLKNGDKVSATLTSNSKCISNNTAISNTLTIEVVTLATPKIVANSMNLSVENVEQGIAYTWQFRQNGVWADIIPLTTGDRFTAQTTGIYRVSATRSNCTAYSDSLSVVVSQRRRGDNPYGIHLYPNPTHGVIILDSLQAIYHWQSLSIIDIYGQQVVTPKNISGQATTSLNVGSLTNGIYFVRLISMDGKTTELKFIRY